MASVRVCLTVDGDGLDPHSLRRSHNPASDLPAIGNQDFIERLQAPVSLYTLLPIGSGTFSSDELNRCWKRHAPSRGKAFCYEINNTLLYETKLVLRTLQGPPRVRNNNRSIS